MPLLARRCWKPSKKPASCNRPGLNFGIQAGSYHLAQLVPTEGIDV